MEKEEYNIKINRFNLSFLDKKLEQEFVHSSIDGLLDTLKVTVIFAIISSVLFNYIGYFGSYKVAFLTDIIMQTIFAVSFYVLAKTSNFKKIYNLFAFFLFSVLTLHVLIDNINTPNLFPFIKVFGIAVFISLVPYINFKVQLFSSFFVVFTVLLFPLFDSSTTFLISIEKSLILLSFFMLISTALYLKQKNQRQSFYQSKLLSTNNDKLSTENKNLEFQSVVGLILNNSTENSLDINTFLEKSLTILINLKSLDTIQNGRVFLIDEFDDLKLSASKNYEIGNESCANDNKLKCQCCDVVKNETLIFVKCKTDITTKNDQEVQIAGYYNIPLKLENKLLGVLNIALNKAPTNFKEEEKFLFLIADILAAVIYRNQLEGAKELQSKIILESHEQIKSSIDYSKRIQESLLASSNFIKDQFDDFIFKYLPKEVVSGDFYFARKNNDSTFICVADCTGHGVPGALVATVGIQELTHLIENEFESVGQIINKLNEKVNNLLNNDQKIGSDGMDLVLLKIDEHNKNINYSGARGLFYMFQNGQLTRYKTDPFSIGQKSDETINFTTQTIPYNTGDTAFLMTDGLIDQLSKINHKRIGSKRVKELMIDIATSESNQKNNIITNFITTHQTEHQIDDITFISFKL